jgi:hypothetical protein
MEMEILSEKFKMGSTAYHGLIVISDDFLLLCWNHTLSATELAGAGVLGLVGGLAGKAVSSAGGAILKMVTKSVTVLRIDELPSEVKDNLLWKEISLMHSAIIVRKSDILKITKSKLTGYKIHTEIKKFKIPASVFSFGKYDEIFKKYGYPKPE